MDTFKNTQRNKWREKTRKERKQNMGHCLSYNSFILVENIFAALSINERLLS